MHWSIFHSGISLSGEGPIVTLSVVPIVPFCVVPIGILSGVAPIVTLSVWVLSCLLSLRL